MFDIKVFFLKNARFFAALMVLALVLFALAGASVLPRLTTQYSMKQFLPEHHALIEKDEKARLQFGLSERQPFFVLLELPAKSGEWLEANRVDRLSAYAKELGAEAGASKVTTLGNVEGASTSAGGITVGHLLELTPEKQWRERVLGDPLLAANLISADGKTTMAIVEMEQLSTDATTKLLERARAIAVKKFPEATIRLGGTAAIQSEMSAVLSSELKNFLLLSLIASLVTLFAFFRNFSSVVVPMFIMVVANIISLAWMAWMGVAFTVLSSTLPILVSITVISMATHTMLRYSADWAFARRHGENPNKLKVLYSSFRALLVPNFLTAVTTSVGFLAIAFTKIPLIRQYGLTVGFSIFIAWIMIMLALPPLLVLFPVPVARNWTARQARWSLFIVQHGKLVCCMVIAAGLAFLWEGRSLNWSPRLFDDLPQDREARLTTEQIDKSLGGMIPLEVIVNVKNEENPWNEPARIRGLDALEKKWRNDESVGSVSGLPDLLRSVARINGKDLPESRKDIAESNFLFSFGETNIVTNFLTPEGNTTRINLRLHDVPAEKMEDVKRKVLAEANAAFPGAEVSMAGMATTVHVLNNELSSDLIYGFWQALGLISLLLLVVFRSLRWTLIAVLPNLISPAMLLGALAVFHTPVKPGIALIFSIALGIAFDNTVYLLGRLRYLIRQGAENFPVGKAWYQEANLCLYSSMALSAGFVVFLGSYFSLNKYFGAYMLISIAGGLLGDLILLPAALAVARKQFLPKPSHLTLVAKEKTMNKRAIAASFALMALIPLSARAVDNKNATAILDAVEKNVKSHDEVADLKMTIIEASGGKKERSIEIRRKGEADKQKVLVRMQSPADLKGTALLSVAEGKQNDQWLYLPSSKQTRRILSSKKSSSFMDSELSYEDMGTSSDRKFANKVLREEEIGGKKFAVIESSPKAGDSTYSKILTWVSLDKYLVGKMEYYDQSQKLLKVSQFSGYKQFDGVWRAQKVQVQNVQNKRGTILELANLKLNKGLGDDEFTEGALSDTD